MLRQEKKKGGRKAAFITDAVHIVTGVIIVILAVIAFWNPDHHSFLFPAIFLLAGILYSLNGMEKLRTGRGHKKQRAVGKVLMSAGVLLLLLSFLSMITIWRR